MPSIYCTCCGKDAERFDTAICINTDGDHVCSEKCKEIYEAEREKFFNVTIQDDKLFSEWLGVKIKDLE